MFAAYRTVLTHPGALLMSATGILARLPISMMTLGMVVLVSATTGSYGTAGAVTAAYTIGNAVVAIPHGRLADRYGQARVLLVDSVLFALATGLLIRSVLDHWGTPWPHVFAALAGVALPQVGSLVRARWAHLLDDPRQLHTAFALESIGDEVVFVGGPTLVTFLSTLLAPQTGLLVALVVGTLGPLLLAAQTGSQPSYDAGAGQHARGAMPWTRLGIITVGAVAVGSLFGAMEVATVAFADDAGNTSASGVILSALSLGSLIAGFLTGAIHWRRSHIFRARVGTAGLTLGFLILPFAGSLWWLGVLMFLAGSAIAPTLIAVMSFTEEIAPKARLTEAMGLLQSGLSAGIAPGAWAAGLVADASGGAAAFWVCVVSGAVALAASSAAH